MKVVLAPEAVDDIEAVVAHIQQDNPLAAAELADRTFLMIDMLAADEIEGPRQTLRSGEEVRSWPIPPLRIYYQRQAECFYVLRIYHQARRPITK